MNGDNAISNEEQAATDQTLPCFDGVALVSGAGSRGPGFGTGKASVVLLARLGWAVVVLDSDAARAEETAELVLGEGGRASSFVADVRDSASAGLAVEHAVSTFGKLTTLVNNVGVYKPGLVTQMTDDDLALSLDVNTKGMLYLTRAAVPAMQEAGGGAVVNISSISAHVQASPAGTVAYAASKGAMESAAKILAGELGPLGIRVNTVVPGTLNTPLLQLALSQKEIELRQSVAPLGAGGNAWDVAQAVAFLAGPWSRWISGATLPVDGGLLTVSAAMHSGA
ncbi:SDR family NAD(P)-dependent oxidoreductase [Rhodococcus opacus]|uniref:Short-chain dehydrogenase n=1 Tax=Rhodococcus opacus TaxID=37919 RepID=A0A2S8J8P5_RHOOP|nr:SDR family NAD(P)-dependent oxidoreductase [Rhodococcus opacus]PQP23375.1 short-chain dehydrogenase [Rhodococcus opacus]